MSSRCSSKLGNFGRDAFAWLCVGIASGSGPFPEVIRLDAYVCDHDAPLLPHVLLSCGHVPDRVLPLLLCVFPLPLCGFPLTLCVFPHCLQICVLDVPIVFFSRASSSLRRRSSRSYDSANRFSIFSRVWPSYPRRWPRSNHLSYWSPIINRW